MPPIHAPPTIGSMCTSLMKKGIPTIISTVKISEVPTANARSVFLAFAAAAAAMAADVPQTEVAAAIVITSGLFWILSTFTPSHHMKMMTIGVTPHAMPRP